MKIQKHFQLSRVAAGADTVFFLKVAGFAGVIAGIFEWIDGGGARKIVEMGLLALLVVFLVLITCRRRWGDGGSWEAGGSVGSDSGGFSGGGGQFGGGGASGDWGGGGDGGD